MQQVTIDNKSFSTPILVLSISSFETQLGTLDALRLQFTLREPISLVSAYDIGHGNKEFADLCQEFRKSSVLLMDSGGYEHSRITRYVGDAPKWSFEEFKAACEKSLYDFVFSYDYFWRDEEESESFRNFDLRLVSELLAHHKFIPASRLIPVIHLQTRNGNNRLKREQILDLVGLLPVCYPTTKFVMPRHIQRYLSVTES